MARRASASSIAVLGSPEAPTLNGTSTSGTPRRPSKQLAAVPQRPPAARSTSSSQKLDGHVNLSNIDPDELFSRHSIAEVKLVQQRLRTDADAKQEELRLMVGERYRDLLEASTSILALAKSSKHVLSALEEMQDTVQAINLVRAPKRAVTGEDKHLQALQSLSAHVKLLLDAPEHLWRLMERKAYLNAAWLFLLARVVHRALSQEDDDQSWQAYGIDVMEQMPLVQRQWDAITPFRSQISHRATLYLREAGNSSGEVCATLLTLHLLESRPLPETLSIYLAQRTKTLSSMLTRSASTSANGDAKPNGKSPHRPRKVVIRETKQKSEAVLDAISQTVVTARATFADSSQGSLMKQALQFFQSPSENLAGLPVELQLTTQVLLATLPSSSHFLLLPQSVRTYKPYIDDTAVMSPALQPQLRDKLENWFGRAIQDVRGALIDWFAGLESVREVWDVRATLLTWLEGAEGLESPERMQLKSMIDTISQHQATNVWKGALENLEASFQQAIYAAIDALESDAGAHPYDTQPVEHLFQVPSLPSLSQTSAQSSVAAARFMKYKTSLRLQLSGRTPLLETALNTLERHTSDIQNDVSVILRPDDNDSVFVALSAAYRTDAESLTAHICDVLDKAAGHEGSDRSLVFIARICQILGSSSDCFTRLGCSPSSATVFRERLNEHHDKLIKRWQERTISRIVENHLLQDSVRIRQSSAPPTQPSHELTQAVISLSSDLQMLGACLEEERRRHQAGMTVRRFIAAYLQRVEGSLSVVDWHQQLWDLVFLQQLDQQWGPTEESAPVSRQIEACIASQRKSLSDAGAPPQSDLASSAQEYLSRTQILYAGLLPSRPKRPPSTAKPEKPSSLLHYGTPAVEQRFEPAVELVKPPPRFGLLLVGGATVR